jgi:hypothetical protein
MLPVFVGTVPGRENWLTQCLASLGNKTATVVYGQSWELGAIDWIYRNTNLDRWLFIHDSMVIKNHKFFDLLEEYPNSVALSSCPVNFGMYVGVFSRRTLSIVGMPKVRNKAEAIHHEIHWCNKYCKAEDVPTMFSDFNDNNNNGVVNRFGRANLVLENEYLIKYKGSWSLHIHSDKNPRVKKV